MTSKLPLSERYVVENGIPTIRLLNSHTGQPMATNKEIEELDRVYKLAREQHAGHPIEWGELMLPDVVNVEEFEIDLSEFGH